MTIWVIESLKLKLHFCKENIANYAILWMQRTDKEDIRIEITVAMLLNLARKQVIYFLNNIK